MTEKRFIRNKSLEEDSIVISDGVIDREKGRILRYDNEYCDLLNHLHEENIHIKTTLNNMIQSERTAIGKSVLKQLKEAIQ